MSTVEKLINSIKLKANPVLLDLVLQNIQETLLAKIDWLDYAFGRAYKNVKYENDGRKYIYPAVYVNDGEYIDMTPNDNLGNFTWFDIYDPQIVELGTRGAPVFSYSGALVLWCNQESIFGNSDFVYLEELKQQILEVLQSPGILSYGKVLPLRVYDRFENIYKGYTIEKVYNTFLYSGEDIQYVDKMFFMHPYAGLRFELNLKIQKINVC